MTELIHASCVAVGDSAVLITGPSGAGKSDLALRLIDRGAVLVSDDQVILAAKDDRVVAAAPPTIAGRIEVRGLGIIAMDYRSPMPVTLLIDLSPTVPRMPEPRTRFLCGLDVPILTLASFEASAPIKVELAMRHEGAFL